MCCPLDFQNSHLPTEEEWEYICRGGPISQDHSKYDFYFAKSKTELTPIRSNDLASNQANFDGNYPAGSASKGPYRESTCEVGLYLPNPLGIYDLHGNVFEWTTSQNGSRRVIRGGTWFGNGMHCTASHSGSLDRADVINGLGFRLLAVPRWVVDQARAEPEAENRNRTKHCGASLTAAG